MPPTLQWLSHADLAINKTCTAGTPLENYRFYIQKAWEILDRCTHSLRKNRTPVV